jgi:hypothetical protein
MIKCNRVVFGMRKLLILVLLFTMVGCQSKQTLNEDDLISSYKAEYEWILSGVYYTATIYRVELDTYSFEYTIFHYLDSDEIQSEKIVVELGDEYLFFIKNDENWIVDEQRTRKIFNLFAINNMNLDWFVNIPDSETDMRENYDLVSSDDYIDEILYEFFHLTHEEIYLGEDTWVTNELYISLNANNQIESAYYASFPTYIINFIDSNEVIELPKDVSDYINEYK